MKIKYIALSISTLCSCSLIAATDNITIDIEQRFTQLEQRLINAERRANDAEAQIQVLQQQQTTTKESTSATNRNTIKPEPPRPNQQS